MLNYNSRKVKSEDLPTLQTYPMFTSNLPYSMLFSITSALAKNWKPWRMTWQAYEVITNLTERGQKSPVTTLIT